MNKDNSECTLSTETSYKVCVGGCEERCQRLQLAVKRQAILREYERLVTEFHTADGNFEQNMDTEDEDLFNHLWRCQEKANIHMVAYRTAHNIASEELKAFHGVKVASSVGDAIRILGGN